jgi:hypothetical protein
VCILKPSGIDLPGLNTTSWSQAIRGATCDGPLSRGVGTKRICALKGHLVIQQRPAETRPGPLARAADHCRELFVRFADGTAAARQAPVPADLVRRVVDIKGAAYFLDAAQVGICRVPGSGWLAGCDHPQYGFAAAAGAA